MLRADVPGRASQLFNGWGLLKNCRMSRISRPNSLTVPVARLLATTVCPRSSIRNAGTVTKVEFSMAAAFIGLSRSHGGEHRTGIMERQVSLGNSEKRPSGWAAVS